MVSIDSVQQRYIRAHQVAQYTGLSVTTIRLYVQKKTIPFIRRGGCVLFDIQELDDWLKEGRVTKITKPAQKVSV